MLFDYNCILKPVVKSFNFYFWFTAFKTWLQEAGITREEAAALSVGSSAGAI